MKANKLFNAVMQLDLTSIKIKLMHVASGEGWSLDKANAVEKEYRRFLCLMKLFPEENTAPRVDVDTFWHYHILDTMKYAADCEQVFGYFLHHDPSVGLSGTDEDEQFRLDSGERMRQLYEATFGDAYTSRHIDEPALPAMTHTDDATAYCASPHIGKIMAGSKDDATAYCASPHIGKVTARSNDDATAYCASPHIGKIMAGSKDDATAYCASPHIGKVTARSNDDATAYCASPHIGKVTARSNDDATAYCASPHIGKITARSKDDATAYCASPHIGKIVARDKDAATAYCASPHGRTGSPLHA